MEADLKRISRLPPAARGAALTEDAYLGSALWRFGTSLALRLFALHGDGRLYQDQHGLHISRSVMVWHNRHKFTDRVQLLELFARQGHCSLDANWALRPDRRTGTARPCCAPDVSWPIHFLIDRRVPKPRHRGPRCQGAADLRARVDLLNATIRQAWGLNTPEVRALKLSGRERGLDL